MIATRIAKKPDVADNYTRLGIYIAAAQEKGEKLDRFWIVNCDAGEDLEDLDTALAEIEAVRAMRPDSPNKSYHLVVSFRPGEGERLGAQELKEIERAFAEALGFQDHQRVVGTHVNTDNFHLHVAYNMVNPLTLKVVHPWKDYAALEKTARAMERTYGLQTDLGLSDHEGQPKGSQKARAFEAHTWQQSFQNHLLGRRDTLLPLFTEAKSWGDLHGTLADQGIALRRRGNGLVLAQTDGPQTMKASLLDRTTSLSALEKRLGAFEPKREPAAPVRRRPRDRYKARPLLRHPATGRLWRRYLSLPSSARASARNWKQFLVGEASKDPMAAILIMAHSDMLDLLFGGSTPSRGHKPKPVPKGLREAVTHWKSARPWRDAGSSWPTAPHAAAPGCGVDDTGTLLVPFRDRQNRLRGLRFLAPDGRTMDLGPLSPDTRHVIDPSHRLNGGKGAVVLTTDHTLARAIHEATKQPVIVVPDESALDTAIKDLRGTHPRVTPVIATPSASNRLKPNGPTPIVPIPANTPAMEIRKALKAASLTLHPTHRKRNTGRAGAKRTSFERT